MPVADQSALRRLSRLLLVAALVLSACAPRDRNATTSADTPSQRAAPDYLTIWPAPFLDRSRTGWPDDLTVVLYLFKQPYSQPYTPEGSLYFRLTDMTGNEISRWQLPPDVTRLAVRDMNSLQGYRVVLRMPPRGGAGRFPRQSNLVGIFEPLQGGNPIQASVILTFGVE